MNELDLHVAIMGSVQSMGYDSPTENQKSAIDSFVRGNVFISLPMGSGKSLCYASLPGVFDRLRQVIKASCDTHNSIVVVVSPLMQYQVKSFQDNGIKAAFIGKDQTNEAIKSNVISGDFIGV